MEASSQCTILGPKMVELLLSKGAHVNMKTVSNFYLITICQF